MPRRRFFVIAGLFLIGLAVAFVLNQHFKEPALPAVRAFTVETAPLCPWRSPEADIAEFFPGVSEHQSETRILSGVRPQLTQELGRLPRAEENALQVHRISGESKTLRGYIITARARGEHGAIELVMALEPDGTIRGVHCQRMREPESVARILRKDGWLGAFGAKDAGHKFQLGEDLPDVNAEAKESARNIAECVRSVLILFRTSERLRATSSEKVFPVGADGAAS
jgi:hypothetical protein